MPKFAPIRGLSNQNRNRTDQLFLLEAGHQRLNRRKVAYRPNSAGRWSVRRQPLPAAGVTQNMKPILVCVTTVLFGASVGRGSEPDAVAISANIQARHVPFGTLLDPIYASPTSGQIVGYTRCGDSALWTGALLAAESFRYKVTSSADALRNVRSALAGLKALSDVTGDNRLARCMVLSNSPYAAGIASEEASNTIHQNPPWIWVDNTSRDQVVGAFFGLGAAFDLVDDPAVKAGVSDLATLLIGYISRHQWSPNDDITSTFEIRPEELQMLLQVARHVNPSNTVSGPLIVPPVGTAVAFDVLSLSSYFKFNLDYMSFYHLLRLQDNGDNAQTDPGQNAQHAAKQDVGQAAMKRDVEYDFEHGKSQQHHHAEQGKQRHDLGDDDFSRAGGRHQQLLHRPSFALSHHGRGCNQRTVHNQQETENTGRNEPGINQAWVVDESRHELHLPPAAYLGRSNLLKAGMNAHALQPGVVSLNDAFRIGLADGGRIRVRGV